MVFTRFLYSGWNAANVSPRFCNTIGVESHLRRTKIIREFIPRNVRNICRRGTARGTRRDTRGKWRKPIRVRLGKLVEVADVDGDRRLSLVGGSAFPLPWEAQVALPDGRREERSEQGGIDVASTGDRSCTTRAKVPLCEISPFVHYNERASTYTSVPACTGERRLFLWVVRK